MFLTNLKRVLIQGWTYFIRQGSLSMAAVLLLVSTLSLITVVFILKGITNQALVVLQDKIDVSIYFKEEVEPDQIFEIQDELKKLPEIKEVEYVSADVALEKFKEKYKDDPIIMESLDTLGVNPLLAALNIKVKEAKSYETVVNFIEASKFKNLIESIDYKENKELIARLYNISYNIALWGLILSVFFGLLAIVIVFNTIRLAILYAKREIETMHLVGASKIFVMGPFVIHGVLIAISAIILTILLFALLALAFSSKLANFIPQFNLINYYFTNLWLIALLHIVLGMGIGVFSSIVAARKYLK